MTTRRHFIAALAAIPAVGLPAAASKVWTAREIAENEPRVATRFRTVGENVIKGQDYYVSDHGMWTVEDEARRRNLGISEKVWAGAL